MRIGTKTIDSFTIFYKQKLRKNQFQYITTTTRKWQKPIDVARFKIILSESISPHFNYSVARVVTGGGKNCYIIEYKNFYPDTDLIIRW
uniref:Uncharacterized protein n=1 Tax=candidate division WOR-3 bacterium TaxID=2052148 RepID=A0A7C4X8U7_UNCW3